MDDGFRGQLGDLIFSRIVTWQSFIVFDGTAPFYLENAMIVKIKHGMADGTLLKEGLQNFYARWFIDKFVNDESDEFSQLSDVPMCF